MTTGKPSRRRTSECCSSSNAGAFGAGALATRWISTPLGVVRPMVTASSSVRRVGLLVLRVTSAMCIPVVLSLAGCQGSSDDRGGGRRVSSSSSASLRQGVPPDSTLDMRQVTKRSRPSYTEGFAAFLQVRYLEGQVFFRARYPSSGGRSTVEIPPGLYRLESFLRPCNGTCARLDPPVDRCSRRLRFSPDRSAKVRAQIAVTPTVGCSIRLRR